jgi:septation ring formation regulator EzrA
VKSMNETIMYYGPFALLLIIIGILILIVAIVIRSSRRRKELLAEIEKLKKEKEPVE